MKAWELINHDAKIKKFYFFPGVLWVIFLMVILTYQILYTYVELFNKQDKALQIILDVFHSGYVIEILIIGWILFLLYLFIIPIFEWALIWYVSKKETLDTQVSLWDSLSKWLYRFLPMFEYGNIFSEFKFISMINIYLFTLRFFGIEYLKLINIVFLILLVISTIINVLFIYCRFEIVLNHKWAFESLWNSSKISILNLSKTLKMYFTLFLVNTRVLLNLVVFLSFPILLTLLVTYITTKIYLLISILIVSTIFLVFIVLLGYLSGVFEILKIATWYYVYQDGNQKLKELSEQDEEKNDNTDKS